jgi:hypothetical protein
MTKYSTDTSHQTTTTWDHDRTHVLFQWSSKPFHSHRHKYETVEQRVIVEYHDGIGADVRWEARSDDSEKFPDSWGLVEMVELRGHTARHTKHERAGYLR